MSQISNSRNHFIVDQRPDFGRRLKLVGTAAPVWACPAGLMIRKTPGVPMENPIISNMFICFKNSITREHEAQKGPQLFLPFWQHFG